MNPYCRNHNQRKHRPVISLQFHFQLEAWCLWLFSGRNLDDGPEKANEIAKAAAAENKKAKREFYNTLSNQVASYAALGTGGASIGQIIFSGAADDATVFRKEMRMIGYEIEGINSSTRGLQAEFANLGNQIVAQTGKEVGEVQQAYLRNIKKGIAIQKGGLKTTNLMLILIRQRKALSFNLL